MKLAALLEGIRRRRKERWEFKWQANAWAPLARDPANQAKCHRYWIEYRHLDDIRALVPMDASTRVLDVGCGITGVLHFVPGRRVGVDPLAERYKTVYTYPPEIEIRKAYAESLPFEDASFDVVFSSNMIDHVEDPVRMVAEVQRVLRPGGHFVLTCEVFGDDQGARNVAHPHTMSAERLLELVAPFETVRRWTSPWIGLRNYVLGNPPSAQLEHVLLLRKRG
jgi:SAM-dependent methyltransferase